MRNVFHPPLPSVGQYRTFGIVSDLGVEPKHSISDTLQAFGVSSEKHAGQTILHLLQREG